MPLAAPMWKSVQMSIKVHFEFSLNYFGFLWCELVDVWQKPNHNSGVHNHTGLDVYKFTNKKGKHILPQACLLLAAKVWSFVAYLFKKQYRTVSWFWSPSTCDATACIWFHSFTTHTKNQNSYLFSDPTVQGNQVWHLPPLSHLQTQTQHGAEKGEKVQNQNMSQLKHISRFWCSTWTRPWSTPTTTGWWGQQSNLVHRQISYSR